MVNKVRVSNKKKIAQAQSQPRAARERRATYRAPTLAGLTRAEKKAVDEFRARLKEILPNGALKNLILYGSKARADAHPGSDIDLLIVYDAAVGDKKDVILDAAAEIEMAAFERNPRVSLDLETLIRTEAELSDEAMRGLPLLQNVAREGIVLEGERVMPKEMNRSYWATAHIADAKRQLGSARVLLEHGDIPSTISMAYFIYLDAARAALIAKGIAPQSHAGTNTLFSQHFVKTGIVAKKFGPHYGRLEKDRLEATYAKQKQFTPDDAVRALAIAEELVLTIENLLPTLLEEK